MNFFIYDIVFLVLFSTALSLFLYKHRKNVKKEGIIILYKTQLGIKFIKYISKKYKKLIHLSEYFIIFVGYLLMAGMLFLLFRLTYTFVRFPELFSIVKIPPLAPLIPYLPSIFKVDFLPPFYFTYWIIVLAVAAIPHEFFHGIFVKARNIKIKSTGFAFLGPFTGAFVEPDEKKAAKLPIKQQLAFLSAGTFANLLSAIFFFFIIWLFFISAYSESGVVFGSYASTIIPVNNTTKITNQELNLQINGELNLIEIQANNQTYYAEKDNLNKTLQEDISQLIVFQETPALKTGLAGIIKQIDDTKIKNHQELSLTLAKKSPGQEVTVKTLLNNTTKEFSLVLDSHPLNSSKAYLGISSVQMSGLGSVRDSLLFFKNPYTFYQPKISPGLTIFIFNLLWWIILVCFSVALVNMMPVGIFDGGRVFYLTILGLTKSKKIAKSAYKFTTYFIIFIFLLLTYLWVVNFF